MSVLRVKAPAAVLLMAAVLLVHMVTHGGPLMHTGYVHAPTVSQQCTSAPDSSIRTHAPVIRLRWNTQAPTLPQWSVAGVRHLAALAQPLVGAMQAPLCRRGHSSRAPPALPEL